MATLDSLEQDLSYIKGKVDTIEKRLQDKITGIEKKLEGDYVTCKLYEAEMGPLKKFFWGVISIMTLGFISGVVTYFVKEGLK